MDGGFLDIIDSKNVAELFENDSLTARAMVALAMENELKLWEYKEWLASYKGGLLKEEMGAEFNGYGVNSCENILISELSKSGKLTFDILQKIRKISHLTSEEFVGSDGINIRRMAIPIEIRIGEDHRDVEIDKIPIEGGLMEDLLSNHCDINGRISVYNYAFSATSYPIHRRGDYLHYFLDRIAMNHRNSAYEISPIRSRSFLYNGKYPENIREYFIIVDVIGGLGDLDKKMTASSYQLIRNSISGLLLKHSGLVDGVKCSAIKRISESFKDICKISMKSFIMDSLGKKVDIMGDDFVRADIYVRTSSMESNKEYDDNQSCLVDIIVPGYWGDKSDGKPVITYRCDNTVEAIEIMSGLEAFFKTYSGFEVRFSTVQYHEKMGGLIYTPDLRFRDAYMSFSKGSTFYYREDNGSGNANEVNGSNRISGNLIEFPGGTGER